MPFLWFSQLAASSCVELSRAIDSSRAVEPLNHASFPAPRLVTIFLVSYTASVRDIFASAAQPATRAFDE